MFLKVTVTFFYPFTIWVSFLVHSFTTKDGCLIFKYPFCVRVSPYANSYFRSDCIHWYIICKVAHEEVHKFYPSPNMAIKSRRLTFFVQEAEGRNHFRDLVIDRETILKWIRAYKVCVCVCGLYSPGVGQDLMYSSCLLWTRYGTVGFCKRLRISWLTKRLSTLQDDLCPVCLDICTFLIVLLRCDTVILPICIIVSPGFYGCF
jgi:hypothetical protein